jgi:hypothetical protein
MTDEKPQDRGECALWHSAGFEVFATEEEAAWAALGVTDSGEGCVHGVQFPDGTIVSDRSWPMYNWVIDEDGRRWRERTGEPEQPIGSVVNPFTRLTRSVFRGDDLRPWMGKRDADN